MEIEIESGGRRKVKKKYFEFLLNPWVIVLGMVAGIIIGLYFKGLVKYIVPIGEIYISILKMSVLPIMISAIIVSISKLLKSKDTSLYLNKIVILSTVFFIGIASIGILVGVLSIPFTGNDPEMKKAIGQLMLDKDEGNGVIGNGEFKSVIKEIDSRHYVEEKQEKPGLVSFIINLIPKNIFMALNKGQTLKIVFFSIILGVMLKFVSEKSSNNLISLFDGLFEAFQALIKCAMYFLPFALCALLADQLSKIGFSIFDSLLKLIILIYISSIVIFFISTLIVWKYAGGSYFRQYSALKDAIMIAFGTRSSYAALPSAISGLVDGLKLDKDSTNLTVSLGFTLCKFGKVLIFCIGAVFAAHLYEYSLGLESYLIIIISSIFAGMAASGAPSIVSRSMIAMVLAPLGIPAEAIIVILFAIDPVVDPVITLISTYPNYAITAIIAGGQEGTFCSE
jgi:proton glutamate symport protein